MGVNGTTENILLELTSLDCKKFMENNLDLFNFLEIDCIKYEPLFFFEKN